MKKTVISIFRILGIVLLSLLALLLIWAAVHQFISLADKKAGQLGVSVAVDGGDMNVYATGEGSNTIVLMPGLGTAAPVLDFQPLADRFAEKYRVVVAEPFGYGWSELTDKPRSVENIVEELRAALAAAGESGPYVLMPHSLSGIYALWYAQHYPEEVSAIVGIDCTLPRQAEYFGGASPSVPAIAKLANPLGLSRLLCLASPSLFISDNAAGEYSQENLRAQKRLASSSGYNRNVIDEMNSVAENIAATEDIALGDWLPVLFITRPESSHTPREDGKTSRSFYETYISAPGCQQILELDAPHYMHWTQSEAIATAAEEFLKQLTTVK